MAHALPHVEEAPAWVVSMRLGERMNARLHGVEDVMAVHRTVDVIPTRVWFAGGTGVGRDELDVVLRNKGKLPSQWAESLDESIIDRDSTEVSDDDASSVREQSGLPRR